jgi:predicted ABC-type sugar transport system permease subunit
VLVGGTQSYWLRLASVLPLAVLVAGLVFIQQHYDWQQIEVAAEVDSALLADDLPPAAYGDPGFLEYLRNADSR